MSAFATFENRLRTAWHDLDSDTRADLEKGFADLKAEVAQLKPVLSTAEADLKQAVAAAEPGIKATVEQLAEKILADAAKALPEIGLLIA